jgi:hypothetical protein
MKSATCSVLPDDRDEKFHKSYFVTLREFIFRKGVNNMLKKQNQIDEMKTTFQESIVRSVRIWLRRMPNRKLRAWCGKCR